MGMTIQEAIMRITDHMEVHHIGEPPHIKIGDALLMAIDALMEKAERDDPKPLTIEELLQMDGELVWFEVIDANDYTVPNKSEWAQVVLPEWKRAVWFWRFGNECESEPKMENYGKTWLAYRHKPKEVSK